MSEEKIIQKIDDFIVIGLGRFGKSLAIKLSSLGHQVLAIDVNPENVHEIENYVTNAVVADVTKPDVLHSLGAQNFDCAIVCIGKDLEASILATLTSKDLKIPFIIAKAQSEQHKRLLEHIGADLVVIPEVFMSKKLASVLSNPTINEAMKITNDFKIIEIKCPESWAHKTILDTNIRKKYNVSIIFIKRDNMVINPDGETELYENDILIIAGEKDDVNIVSNKSSGNIDIKGIFADSFGDD